MDRRAFVKGCVGAGIAGAAVAAGYGMGKPLSNVKGGAAKVVNYISAKKTGGPAPRGVGIIPVDVDADGNVSGPIELGGTKVLDWFKYCGHNAAPGLTESYTGDNLFRYFITPDKIAAGFNPWYKPLVGQVMNVKEFPEPGFGAAFNWRSEGASGADIITGIIIRVGNDPENIPLNYDADLKKTVGMVYEKVDQKYVDAITAQIKKTGFLAFTSYCTHFCCVPGWTEAKDLALSKNAYDKMFCTCHFSIYDPFTITTYKFLLDEAGGDDAAGGH